MDPEDPITSQKIPRQWYVNAVQWKMAWTCVTTAALIGAALLRVRHGSSPLRQPRRQLVSHTIKSEIKEPYAKPK